MQFWASSETFQPAGEAIERTRRCVEPYLNKEFAASSLAPFECKLRYIPIVMPQGMRDGYPARSKLRKKERIYECAPQLDYGVFAEGTFAECLREYMRGIALSAVHLAGLGASPEQIKDFEAIVRTAPERILTEQA